jgi:hypothetical protein
VRVDFGGRVTQVAQYEVPKPKNQDTFASFVILFSMGGLCTSRTMGNFLCAPTTWQNVAPYATAEVVHGTVKIGAWMKSAQAPTIIRQMRNLYGRFVSLSGHSEGHLLCFSNG